MISELIVSKITLESIKYILQKEAKEKDIYPYITLRMLSALSDVTTCGIACWALNFNYFDGASTNNQIAFEEEREKKRNREIERKRERESLEKIKTLTEEQGEMLEELKTTIRDSV